MEVAIISKVFIKPSSSTPSHLKTYQISLLDQFSSSIFYSFALFYAAQSQTDHLIHQRSIALKRSLSQTLSRFYPLAGKIKDNLSIDCDDGGACYSEATANISLAQFLTQPDLTLLDKLVPDVSAINQNPIGAHVSLIQETTFTCGGLGIGLSVSHTALDGIALASFVKAWASTAFSSGEQIVYPNLDSPIRFPQYGGEFSASDLAAASMPFMKNEKLAVRRFLFDAYAIAELKRKAATSSILENPSKVEVISALITRCLMAVFNAKSGSQKPMAVNHNVNMRAKADPPFPNCSLGNFAWIAHAICSSAEKDRELSSLVWQLRSGIRKIDSEFVKKIESEEGGGFKRLFEAWKERENALSNGVEFIIFSSWCNFGWYDCDFGWGKPIWTAHCSLIDQQEITFMNMAYLNDTPNGNGVEVWLYVPQDIAAVLETDSELLQYVSVNPSPISVP